MFFAKPLPIIMMLVLLGASETVTNFHRDIDVLFGGPRAKIVNGHEMMLSVDNVTGSGFQTKKDYRFGRFDLEMKLVPGNSAGIVSAFYLSSETPKQNEVDLEFLGNSTGQPYTLHTNVCSQGNGNKEQQFRLWFDPTSSFHTYSIIWNPDMIIILVDNIPIRVFPNLEHHGIPYLNRQPMRVFSTIWNANNWATQGGRVKTDWAFSPFSTFYRNLYVDGCSPSPGCPAAIDCHPPTGCPAARHCHPPTGCPAAIDCHSPTGCSAAKDCHPPTGCPAAIECHPQTGCLAAGECHPPTGCPAVAAVASNPRKFQVLDTTAKKRLLLVQRKYMIYNYCKDVKRFFRGLPLECTLLS